MVVGVLVFEIPNLVFNFLDEMDVVLMCGHVHLEFD
jgi:hypothetical protein